MGSPAHHRIGRLTVTSPPMSHLRSVPDPHPPSKELARGEVEPTIAELERWATVHRLACVRMLAVAKSGPPRLVALSGRHRLGALQPRASPRPGEPGVARARPLRPLQGARGPDPVRGARPPRLLPARRPPGSAQDRRPASGPSRHEQDGRGRGFDGLARAGPLDVRRHRPGAAARRPRRHGARLRRPLRWRLPGGPDLGGRDGGGRTSASQHHRDRRLQPSADRRHDRAGHGHRRRSREVRGVRMGLDPDRRPRHGGDRRSARAQPHPRPARGDHRADQEGPRRLVHGGPLRLSRQAAQRPSRPSRRSKSSRPGSRSRPRRSGGRSRADGRQVRAQRDAQRLRRGPGRAGRGARGCRRARCRPFGLDPIGEVRQRRSPIASSTSGRPRPT